MRPSNRYAVAVFDGANDVADMINALSVNRTATLQTNAKAAQLQEQLNRAGGIRQRITARQRKSWPECCWWKMKRP